MAQNYTRQSSMADGDTITAALFNNEYNQLVNAFAYSSSSASSTGHRHDGSTGQGGNVPQIGDLDFLNKVVVDGTNNRVGFFVEVSSSAVEQIRVQDGAIVPVTDNDIDLGTSSLEFKDLFLDGTAHVDTLDVDVNATIAGTLGVTGVLTGSSLDISGDIDIDGTSNLDVVDIDGAVDMATTLNVAGVATVGGLTIGSAVITEAELETIDTITAGTITASKAVVVDSNKDVSSFRNVTLTGELDAATGDFSGNVDIDGDLLVGDDLTLDSDAAVLGFGADTDVTLTHVADTGLLLNSTMALQFNDASQFINAPSATVLDINATDEIELNATLVDINANVEVSGTLTVAGAVDFGDAALSNVGAVQLDSIAGDADSNTSITFSGSDVITIAAGGDNQVTFTNGAIVPSTDNDIDLGTSSVEFKDAFFDGTVTTDALVADTADINGGTVDGAIIGGNSAAAITGTAITGTSFVIGSADISEAELETIDGVTAGTVAASKAVVVDANKDIGSFRNITLTGELDAGSLDISGDADIDGTLETDALSINGTAVTSTAAELNILDGVTSTAAELNILDGVTSTAAELNALDGITAVVGELNALDLGSTAIGTAIASKAVILDSDKDYTGIRNFSITGNLSVGGTTTIVDTVTMNAQNAVLFEGATADAHETTLTIVDPTADRTINLPNQSGTVPVLAAASNTAVTSTPEELNVLDGITAVVGELNALDLGSTAVGTAIASKAVILDSNKDYTGIRNFTISGELDAASLDISGDIDVDGTTNLDVVDIDGAVDMASTLTVGGATTITVADNSDVLTLISTDADANQGPILNLFRNSGSPADSDVLAQVLFSGENDADEEIEYSRFQGFIVDASDGTEDGGLNLQGMLAGTLRSRLKTNATELVINDDSQDIDFRVESDGSTHMLFVDAGNNNVAVGHSSAGGAKFAISDSGNATIQFFPEISTDTNLIQHYDLTAAAYMSAEQRAADHAILIGTDQGFRMESTRKSVFTTAVDGGVGLQLNNTSGGQGSVFTFYNASGSPANDDVVGVINFNGNDSTGTETNFARISAASDNIANGSENGFISFAASGSGSLLEHMRINSAGVIVNEISQAGTDFRVESNDFTHMLFVDSGANRVGVGTGSPSGTLHISGGGTSAVPSLQIDSSTSDAFNHAANAFNSNLTAGEHNIFIIGKEGSSKNSGYIGFKWNGDGSNANLLTFGFWANDNLMNLTGDGNFIVGGTSSGASGAVTLRADGVMIAPQVYSTAVSASLRDLQIDSSGFFGYSTSTRATKDNIEPITDVSWLLNLEPVSFNRKITETEVSTETEYGLVADDVELVNANICFYDETENGKELVGITYSKLITPILKLVQEQQTLIESLTTRIAALEGE